ncbi:hypothetical protein Tco_0084366 [Tanacetum coccineum]
MYSLLFNYKDKLDNKLNFKRWSNDSLLGGKQPVPEVHRFKLYIGSDDSKLTDNVLFVAERTRIKDSMKEGVNKRTMMQTQESKIDTGKALDADLVDTESIRTDSTVQDDSSRSGNDTDADDADIRPIYDEEVKAVVQLTAECNFFAIGQQHTEQPEIIVEGRVDQYPETCQVKSPMLDSSPDNQGTTELLQTITRVCNMFGGNKEIVCPISKRFFKNRSTCICS